MCVHPAWELFEIRHTRTASRRPERGVEEEAKRHRRFLCHWRRTLRLGYRLGIAICAYALFAPHGVKLKGEAKGCLRCCDSGVAIIRRRAPPYLQLSATQATTPLHVRPISMCAPVSAATGRKLAGPATRAERPLPTIKHACRIP